MQEKHPFVGAVTPTSPVNVSDNISSERDYQLPRLGFLLNRLNRLGGVEEGFSALQDCWGENSRSSTSERHYYSVNGTGFLRDRARGARPFPKLECSGKGDQRCFRRISTSPCSHQEKAELTKR